MAFNGAPGRSTQFGTYSNEVPQTYNLTFLDGIGTPLQNLAALSNCQPPVSTADAVNAVQTDALKRDATSRTATDDILTSLSKKVSNAGAAKKREFGAGVTPAEASEVLSAGLDETPYKQQYNKINNLPLFTESYPGTFIGQAVNSKLNPTEVPIRASTNGNIFGGAASALIGERISQINGFNYSVNNGVYSPDPRQPGGVLRPLIDGNFYVTFGPGNPSTNVGRITEYSKTGTIPFPGFTNNVLNSPWSVLPAVGSLNPQTQGLALRMNNLPGRIIYLTRRLEPYYFHFCPPSSNSSQSDLGGGVSSPKYDTTFITTYGGLYFTTDPVGGGPWNDINIINGQACPPPVYPGTEIAYVGSVIQICVDNTWPDVLFYQCTLGPFMGGLVIVMGSLNSL